MTLGEGTAARSPRALVSARGATWAVGALTAVFGLMLWALQLSALSTPCVVPGCTWPRLSSDGFATLAQYGISPPGWAVIAGGVSLVSSGVLWLLGFAVARIPDGNPRIAALLFVFALGPLSSSATDPLAAAIVRVLALGAWFTLFALFPSGTFRPRWVAIAPLVALGWTLVLLTPAVAAAESANDPFWWTLEAAVYICCVILIVIAQVVQLRRADEAGRRAVRLLLIPFGLFVLFGIATAVLNAHLDPAALGYGTLGGAILYEISAFLTLVFIACTAVATVRHGAYGLRIALDRVLVATLVLAAAGIVYAAVVVIASRLLSGWMPAALAAIATATALAGAYSRIERGVGRLVYGDADDPAAVTAALDTAVGRVSSPQQLLPAIASTLADRLRFTGVRVSLDREDGRTDAAASGDLPPSPAFLPLAIDGHPLGSVEVALRTGQRRLTARDRRALAAASGPLAAAATALRLNEELGRSRLEALISRDDERRALRRRLHDEVGPTLALAGHRITAAADDPAQLGAAAQSLADAVAQVRSISRDLRPPALDELGLRRALAAFAAGLSLPVAVDAPEHIAPGALEVAVYRIAVEALLNTTRHARATSATVTVARDDTAWVLDIDDDGTGIPSGAVPGVGTLSMRERTEELGGVLTIGASAQGGTRVRAVIPTADLKDAR